MDVAHGRGLAGERRTSRITNYQSRLRRSRSSPVCARIRQRRTGRRGGRRNEHRSPELQLLP
jgi:hypothetical protein